MPTSRVYLLGGEDILKRTMKDTDKQAISEAGENPVVLVFPWTSESEKKKYRKVEVDYFKDLGARKVIFGELTDSLQRLREKINTSNMVYLPGGDTDLLFNRLRNSGVSLLLKKYMGVLVGNSAGSLVLCKRYVIIKGQDASPVTKVFEGIGVVDFAVAVHYKSGNSGDSGEEPDKSLRALSRKFKTIIYAIPENGALIFDKETLRFVGEIFSFKNGKKRKCQNHLNSQWI
jgi:peptidase E